MSGDELQGSILFFVMFDVSEEIDLGNLGTLLGRKPGERSFKHSAPEYLRLQRVPLIDDLELSNTSLPAGMKARISFYDYGVIVVLFELPFQRNWQGLVVMASQTALASALEASAEDMVRKRLANVAAAIVGPYERWLREDYTIFHVRPSDPQYSAKQLLDEHGENIVQMVRGEQQALSKQECDEVLRSSISYYPNDLAVIGWNAAFVYDTDEGAQTTIQVLEYANTQLLELRHYDELLSRDLTGQYRRLKQRGLLAGWRRRRAALQLEAVTVEITELVERVDNAIKFFSDMFAARLYRLAASKVGVQDYKQLVNQKLQTAENLSGFLTEMFHQERGFLLEFLVVIILLIELVYLFEGKG